MVCYEDNKRKLPCSSSSDLTYFIQKCNLNCYLRHKSNGFKQENSIKKNAPTWRGIYYCTNNGCCRYEFSVDYDDSSDDMVEFCCLIYGDINHENKINNEILRHIDSKEKTMIALKLLANNNNTETVANMKIEELKLIGLKVSSTDANSEKLLGQINFDNIKTLNLKNKLKDRYRKILENLHGN
jgi:hypothetical protein